MSQEIEIGLGKKGRLAYSLDDVSIVPSRRTRDPEDVSTAWQVDAYEFDIPVVSAPMDSVTSPTTAIAMGKLGALGVLDLEGLWTRYDDPQPQLDEIAGLPAEDATVRIQEIYRQPIRAELITKRLHEIRDAGVTVAAALSPQRIQEFYETVVKAGVDLFVIRGTAVSAEQVSNG
ncbi:MAG: IMP dehydrogenase, partial [Bifidobacterium mongoliense]|nr:IMP dehydrogenase [Bifidobacterium mongoliense]